MRSTARDGLRNRLEFHVLTSFAPAWAFAERRPVLRRQVNKRLIDSAILKVPTRPNPLSTLAPYSSWSSLRDRRADGPPPPPWPAPGIPPAEDVAALFARGGETELCP